VIDAFPLYQRPELRPSDLRRHEAEVREALETGAWLDGEQVPEVGTESINPAIGELESFCAELAIDRPQGFTPLVLLNRYRGRIERVLAALAIPATPSSLGYWLRGHGYMIGVHQAGISRGRVRWAYVPRNADPAEKMPQAPSFSSREVLLN
jgi:hypothetical protein